MIQRNNQTAWGLFNGVLAGALWGMVFLAPALTTAFSALQLAVGRYLLYGAVACALLLPLWPALRAQVDRRAWLALAGLSLLGNLVYFVFLAMAVLGGLWMPIAVFPAAMQFIAWALPSYHLGEMALMAAGQREAANLWLHAGPLALITLAAALFAWTGERQQAR